MMRDYIKTLDKIAPKDNYSIGVTYVPRNASHEKVRTLLDVPVRKD